MFYVIYDPKLLCFLLEGLRLRELKRKGLGAGPLLPSPPRKGGFKVGKVGIVGLLRNASTPVLRLLT